MKRALIKCLHPRQMYVRLMTIADHADAAFDANTDDDDDSRPHFDRASFEACDEPTYDAESDEDDDESQGDLATASEERFSAETRFCIALSLEWKETKAPTNPDTVEITTYEYRRISMHPDAAAYLIGRLTEKHRKIIADALVFQLIRDEGEKMAEEEWEDGGIAPAWRNRENDPAQDILTVCTHLRDLYFSMLEEPPRRDASLDEKDG